MTAESPMTPIPETIAVIAIGVTLAAVVLQQIRSLGARLETRIDRLEARIARLEAGQEALVERVARIEAGQEALGRDVKELARDLAALSERTARIERAVIGPWRPEEAGTGKS